ncbi:MAG TPA: DNA gyrase inhibitor YacG [Planctomycetota bacterium]|jgi:hypothetical protein
MTPDSKPSSSNDPVKTARCPRCGKEFQYTRIAAHKVFPFCSQRCRDIDMGNWLTGKYAIPGQPIPPVSDDQSEHDGT